MYFKTGNLYCVYKVVTRTYLQTMLGSGDFPWWGLWGLYPHAVDDGSTDGGPSQLTANRVGRRWLLPCSLCCQLLGCHAVINRLMCFLQANCCTSLLAVRALAVLCVGPTWCEPGVTLAYYVHAHHAMLDCI